MMRMIDDHHLLAIYTTNLVSLEILEKLPEADIISELLEILTNQYDIINCVIQSRHFGSDCLDDVISSCNKMIEQCKEIE